MYVFTALFIYIRIVEARNFHTCTSLGNIYSGVIFVLVGILTLICAMFGLVFTIFGIFNGFAYMCKRYCCCCGGQALVPKRLVKIPYSIAKFPSHSDCAVCLMEFKEGDIVTPLPCNIKHFFHRRCIRDWLERTPQCPLCKKQVTPSKLKEFGKRVDELLEE